MKKTIMSGVAAAGLSMAALGASQAPGPTPAGGAPAPTEVRGGSITFDVGTNIFAINVHGASGALDGRARVHEIGQGLRLEDLEAVVPVDSLRTGMKQRDGHMRKYIFQTPDGKAPDVRFSAKTADCSPADSSRAVTCVASGQLTIRGTARPFSIPLKVTRVGEEFRVSGDGAVALSTYGIERPSQFGVKTEDEVKLHLEFNARAAAPTAVATAGSR